MKKIKIKHEKQNHHEKYSDFTNYEDEYIYYSSIAAKSKLEFIDNLATLLGGFPHGGLNGDGVW